MKTWRRAWAAGCLSMAAAAGAGAGPLREVPLRDVTVTDAFWAPKREVWQRVTIRDCFAKFEKDGALTNFDHVRDGTGAGTHGGPAWYDGLLYEMITGSSDFLASHPDPALRAQLAGYIVHIAAAAGRDPDGYINTFTQLKEPTHRWGLNGGDDVLQHDLYNAGCLVEAGVHHYRATGDAALLAVAARLANHMCDGMGPAPKRNIVPGHAMPELAFVQLHRLLREQPELKGRLGVPVDEGRYLELAQFWIDARGHHEGRRDFGAYDQDHVPVLEQQMLEGHAVRATLMASGLTALATTTGRADYLGAADRLWHSMADRRTYISGGVGASANEEKFGPDYELPNTGYLETCAAVGAAMFHHQINLAQGDARAADELERSLYNGALAGVSLAGDTYNYENPLQAKRDRMRWAWHPCPCCPPMFLKLMGAMPGYIYAADDRGVYINLFVGSRAAISVGGTAVTLTQATGYPWSGEVRIALDPASPAEFNVHVRVPAWCGAEGEEALYRRADPSQPASAHGLFSIRVNGSPVDAPVTAGYATVRRRWDKGDVITLGIDVAPRRVAAHPLIQADRGKVALMAGPLLYCLESTDNPDVGAVTPQADGPLDVTFVPDMLGGVATIHGRATVGGGNDAAGKPHDFTAVPFYANGNRGPRSMVVWAPAAQPPARGH